MSKRKVAAGMAVAGMAMQAGAQHVIQGAAEHPVVQESLLAAGTASFVSMPFIVVGAAGAVGLLEKKGKNAQAAISESGEGALPDGAITETANTAATSKSKVGRIGYAIMAAVATALSADFSHSTIRVAEQAHASIVAGREVLAQVEVFGTGGMVLATITCTGVAINAVLELGKGTHIPKDVLQAIA